MVLKNIFILCFYVFSYIPNNLSGSTFFQRLAYTAKVTVKSWSLTSKLKIFDITKTRIRIAESRIDDVTNYTIPFYWAPKIEPVYEPFFCHVTLPVILNWNYPLFAKYMPLLIPMVLIYQEIKIDKYCTSNVIAITLMRNVNVNVY